MTSFSISLFQCSTFCLPTQSTEFRLNIAEMKSSDGVNSQLSISRSDRHDSGHYKCLAENPFGKSEHTIYLAVQGRLRLYRIYVEICNTNIIKPMLCNFDLLK